MSVFAPSWTSLPDSYVEGVMLGEQRAAQRTRSRRPQAFGKHSVVVLGGFSFWGRLAAIPAPQRRNSLHPNVSDIRCRGFAWPNLPGQTRRFQHRLTPHRDHRPTHDHNWQCFRHTPSPTPPAPEVGA